MNENLFSSKSFWKIHVISTILIIAIITEGGEPVFHIKPTFATSIESAYKPQVRHIQISTTPLIIKEQQSYMPKLKDVFGPKGVLNSTEVYGFNPDTLIAYKGDKVILTITNTQADDSHTFTIDAPYNIDINLQPNSVSTATFIANHVGSYKFYCHTLGHFPWMQGTLLVLPDSNAVD